MPLQNLSKLELNSPYMPKPVKRYSSPTSSPSESVQGFRQCIPSTGPYFGVISLSRTKIAISSQYVDKSSSLISSSSSRKKSKSQSQLYALMSTMLQLVYSLYSSTSSILRDKFGSMFSDMGYIGFPSLSLPPLFSSLIHYAEVRAIRGEIIVAPHLGSLAGYIKTAGQRLGSTKRDSSSPFVQMIALARAAIVAAR